MHREDKDLHLGLIDCGTASVFNELTIILRCYLHYDSCFDKFLSQPFFINLIMNF